MDSIAGSDDGWRLATYGLMAAAAVLYLVGGLVTRVAGAWRLPDGTVVTLKQAGPWLWGRSSPPGGEQIWRGQAVWGRLRLSRRDRGIAHLRRLGFDDQQAAIVEGRETGMLRLRRVGDELVGDFVGYAFSFDAGRVASRRLAPPQARRLSRA